VGKKRTDYGCNKAGKEDLPFCNLGIKYKNQQASLKMMKVIFPPHKGQGKSEYDAKPKQLDFALTILRDKKGDATQIEIVLWGWK